MRITDLLDIRSIKLDAAPKSKQETLDAAVALMVKSGKITDEEAYRAQVYAREEESTTGIGEGIAIPHGKCDAVAKPGLAAMVIPEGVDFDSLDGEPVTLLFLIAAPNTKDNVHLDVLSKLSMMLMDEEFTKSLRSAKTPEEFLSIIDRADEEKKSVDERLAADKINPKVKRRNADTAAAKVRVQYLVTRLCVLLKQPCIERHRLLRGMDALFVQRLVSLHDRTLGDALPLHHPVPHIAE